MRFLPKLRRKWAWSASWPWNGRIVSLRWSHHTFCDYLCSTLLTLLTLSYEPYTHLPSPLFKTFNDSHQSHKIEDNRPKCYCHNKDTRQEDVLKAQGHYGDQEAGLND